MHRIFFVENSPIYNFLPNHNRRPTNRKRDISEFRDIWTLITLEANMTQMESRVEIFYYVKWLK